MAAGDNVCCSKDHGRVWQKMFSVNYYMESSKNYNHVVSSYSVVNAHLWYLLLYEYHDTGKCTLVHDIQMTNCEGEPIIAYDMSWDYDQTIFITNSENSHLHIYDIGLSGKYEGEILVNNGYFDKPHGILVNIKNKLLYLGQNHGNIIVYEKSECK